LGSIYSFYHSRILFIFGEVGQLLSKKYHVYLSLFSLFITVLFYNLGSIAPIIFPIRSHPSLIIPIGLLFWVVVILFGWFNSPSFIMKSLLPQGTPYILIPFMVLIEIISLLIRPVTLSVRLTANITAGHLLISILISFLSEMGVKIIHFIPILLINFLELGVAVIQSYVFVILVSIYSSEV